MRQVILYTAVSLDSYIAKPDGNVEWLNSPDYVLENEDYGYNEFYKNIDITLMGNKTYKQIIRFGVPFPYPDKTNYIFTRSPGNRTNGLVKTITGDIIGFVQQLRNNKGRDIWLVGGGQINTLMLNNNLIDKIILTIFPIVLGHGIALFERKANETKFYLQKTKSFKNGLVQLTLNKKIT